MIKLGAKELRTTKATEGKLRNVRKNPIYIIVDNVLDTYNVGSIFRLADAVAAKRVFLCGQTEIPPNTRIKKASINTTEWASWEYRSTAADAIATIKAQIASIQIVAVEQSKESVLYDEAIYMFPLALIVGNETHGVSKEALALADEIVEIPMWGVNKSLNVMVSLAVVLFKAMEKAG